MCSRDLEDRETEGAARNTDDVVVDAGEDKLVLLRSVNVRDVEHRGRSTVGERKSGR